MDQPGASFVEHSRDKYFISGHYFYPPYDSSQVTASNRNLRRSDIIKVVKCKIQFWFQLTEATLTNNGLSSSSGDDALIQVWIWAGVRRRPAPYGIGQQIPIPWERGFGSGTSDERYMYGAFRRQFLKKGYFKFKRYNLRVGALKRRYLSGSGPTVTDKFPKNKTIKFTWTLPAPVVCTFDPDNSNTAVTNQFVLDYVTNLKTDTMDSANKPRYSYHMSMHYEEMAPSSIRVGIP